MLFVTIRVIGCSLAFMVCFILIRRSNLYHKQKLYTISFALAAILMTVSFFVPIENAFVTFPSLEMAYNYSNNNDINLIIHGEKTDFVVGTKDDTNNYAIIPKENNGWKMGMGVDIKTIFHKVYDDIVIYIYKSNNSSDCYITVLNTKGGSIKIKDNKNSEFQYLYDTNEVLNKTFYTYYAYITDFDEEYTISINDKSIKLLK